MTDRPCGCEIASPCVCDPRGVTASGAFRKECRYCGVVWEGRRLDVGDEWWRHVQSDEHWQTYLARRVEIEHADALREVEAVETAREVERVAVGLLW